MPRDANEALCGRAVDKQVLIASGAAQTIDVSVKPEERRVGVDGDAK